MSWNPNIEPHYPTVQNADAIETIIIPRTRDIGAFEVRRALPTAGRRMVGPFVFFDEMGPAEFLTGQGIDVRPHPHIGLATVTYLFDGGFQHRDSLGTNQMIHPGEVNWMVAGNGVTHSERTSQATRQGKTNLFGIQTWVGLPEDHEDDAASFEHSPEADLPFLQGEGKEVRLILGNAWGEKAPVTTFSEMFYADAILQAHAKIPMPDNHEDRGVFIVQGSITVAGQDYKQGQMMVFRPGDAITLEAGLIGARLILLGGETLNGPRHIWWNFVSSSKDKIEAAKQAWIEGDWEHGRFKLPPGDDQEFIPITEK